MRRANHPGDPLLPALSVRLRSGLWPAARAALWGVLALFLLLGGCERKPQGPEATTYGGRPFPELGPLRQIVQETRSVLPLLPAVDLPALPEATAQGQPAPRRVLVGTARLLRPSAFPGLAPRLNVELYLDDRSPPGGHLQISRPEGEAARWPLLPGFTQGRRGGDFSFAFPVHDPTYRLRYFALLGLLYESEGNHYRAFEGYLVFPDEGGGLTGQGAVYPIDFGTQWPEPPAMVLFAAALEDHLRSLRARLDALHALQARARALQADAERLRRAELAPEKEAQRRQDLAEFGRRIQELSGEEQEALAALRAGLGEAYRDRAQLAQAWAAYVTTNPYRWRSPAEQRAAYRPLAALRPWRTLLETVASQVVAEDDPTLRKARQVMEEAIGRETELAPPAEASGN